MRILTIARGASTDQGTFSDAVTADAALKIHTLELPWRDNHTGHSCIPPGEYTCHWEQSPSKGWCYHVQNVPSRSHILIHAANFAGDVDKGWEAELLGCIAPGTLITDLENAHGKVQRAVANSRLALHKLNDWAAREDFLLKIIAGPT